MFSDIRRINQGYSKLVGLLTEVSINMKTIIIQTSPVHHEVTSVQPAVQLSLSNFLSLTVITAVSHMTVTGFNIVSLLTHKMFSTDGP